MTLSSALGQKIARVECTLSRRIELSIVLTTGSRCGCGCLTKHSLVLERLPHHLSQRRRGLAATKVSPAAATLHASRKLHTPRNDHSQLNSQSPTNSQQLTTWVTERSTTSHRRSSGATLTASRAQQKRDRKGESGPKEAKSQLKSVRLSYPAT